MKAPRFMREYAAYKIKEIEHFDKEFPAYHEQYTLIIERIKKYVQLYERGYLQVDEAMEKILFSDRA